MGCDIHIYVERVLKGRWIPVDPPASGLDYSSKKVMNYEDDRVWKAWDQNIQYRDATSPLRALADSDKQPEEIYPEVSVPWSYGRDYESFGYLAGVRRDGLAFSDPRGIPEDISPETAAEQCPGDDHSQSYYTLEELSGHMFRKRDLPERLREFLIALKRTAKKYKLPPDQIRTVFWFDN